MDNDGQAATDPDDGTGVHVASYARADIGGPGGAGSVIASNGTRGALVTSAAYLGGPARGIDISRNRIHGNGLSGIGLTEESVAPGGHTPKDPLDADTGANDLQNRPVLTRARSAGTHLTVDFELESAPNRAQRIDPCANLPGDGSGYGAGQIPLAVNIAATTGPDRSTSGSILFPVEGGASPAWLITATATDLATRDTSALSPCIAVASASCAFGSGGCLVPNGTPGCDSHDGCCDPVCAVDPCCRDTMWDALCAAPCAGDAPLVASGVAAVEDIILLLATWGEAGPPRPRGDLALPPTGDGVEVGMGLSIMMAFVIVNWTFARPRWLAPVVFWILMAALTITTRRPDIAVDPAVGTGLLILVTTAFVLVVCRFGLLAMLLFITVRSIVLTTPITLDFASWYVAPTAVLVLLVLAPAAYGFVVSTAGQPWATRSAGEAGSA